MIMRSHYISDLDSLDDGEIVTIAGFVNEVRDLKNICFLVMRDSTGMVQVTAKKSNYDEKLLEKIIVPKETVMSVKGKIAKGKGANAGIEIILEDVEILSKVYGKVPFDITDLEAIPEIDVRLDNRHIDLRRKEIQAIFEVRANIQRAFRDYLTSEKFKEVVPTSITGSITEGGTDVFEVKYFDKKAYLAQSPQLYKQMCIAGGFDRVFMQIPIFRAEPHATTTHLNEVYQMDVELAFSDDNLAMDYLENTFKFILNHVVKNCSKELELLKVELKIPGEIPRITYTEMIDSLNKNGYSFNWGEDISREHEKKVCEIYGSEAVLITKWPTELRAFYSKPDKENPKVCNAFDLLYKGMEICSGAQRIHDPEELISQLKERGLNPEQFEFYIRTFNSGCPPHAGWSIGAERLTMLICGLSNIRETVLFPRDQNRLFP
jgi:nondiscriminating aspartyl-tRNA synthetase